MADDHTIVREGLRALIEDRPGFEVVGEAVNGREAVKLCRELKPDLILMDVGMSDLNGIEATRRITKESPGTKVLGLSMYSRQSFVLEMLKAGASGYILKNSAFKELTAALKMLAAGKPYLSPEISAVVLACLASQPGPTSTEAAVLTPREREILQLVAQGEKSRDIADELHVSIKTVQTHRRNIMDKLGLRNLPQLTRYAIQEGLISAEL